MLQATPIQNGVFCYFVVYLVNGTLSPSSPLLLLDFIKVKLFRLRRLSFCPSRCRSRARTHTHTVQYEWMDIHVRLMTLQMRFINSASPMGSSSFGHFPFNFRFFRCRESSEFNLFVAYLSSVFKISVASIAPIPFFLSSNGKNWSFKLQIVIGFVLNIKFHPNDRHRAHAVTTDLDKISSTWTERSST